MDPVIDLKARKRALRAEVRARIKALLPDDRRLEEFELGQRLETLPGFAPSGTVLLYASAFADEPDTTPWLARSLALGHRVVIPRVGPGGLLDLFAIEDPARDLIAGFRGIPEPGPGCRAVDPGSIDWALVPGLAFDRSGGRLGRGAGHYDRLLPRLGPEVPTWALIFQAQWVEAVPIEPHDRRLTGVADRAEVVTGSP